MSIPWGVRGSDPLGEDGPLGSRIPDEGHGGAETPLILPGGPHGCHLRKLDPTHDPGSLDARMEFFPSGSAERFLGWRRPMRGEEETIIQHLSPPPLLQTSFRSPFGRLRLLAEGETIRSLGWDPSWDGVPSTSQGLSRLVERILTALESGVPPSGLRLDPQGTPFQKKVWKALSTIPRGKVETYGAIAQAIGCERGHRAVAQACGANPIVILIPCHRVIAARRRLGGYGPGPRRKITLLRNEGLSITLTHGEWIVHEGAP